MTKYLISQDELIAAATYANLANNTALGEKLASLKPVERLTEAERRAMYELFISNHHSVYDVIDAIQDKLLGVEK